MTLHPLWAPKDQRFRQGPGRAAARRHLWLTIPALILAFATALSWSAWVVHLATAGVHYTTNQLFWLAALPALSAATLRIFCHAPAPPLVGGRRFTVLAAASLLLPALGTGWAMQDPRTPYEWMVVLALLCGLGGGNLASALAARFGTGDPGQARGGFAEQAVIFTRQHNWLMCWLCLGSFGSVIGFSAGLPLLLQSQSAPSGVGPAVWLGPVLGVLMGPVGGWLAGRVGAARVSFWAFVALASGAGGLLQGLPVAGQGGQPAGLLAGVALLFAAAGIASGSTHQMIEAVFPAQRQRAAGPLPSSQARAMRDGQLEAAAVLGFAGAIGTYGGFVIPKSLGTALALTGSPAAALWAFIAFYVSCIAVTWWFYSRRHAPMPC